MNETNVRNNPTNYNKCTKFAAQPATDVPKPTNNRTTAVLETCQKNEQVRTVPTVTVHVGLAMCKHTDIEYVAHTDRVAQTCAVCGHELDAIFKEN